MNSIIPPPTRATVRNYIEGTYNIVLNNHTFMDVLTRAGLKSEVATPIEDNRYFCEQNKIDFFYSLLEGFFL